MVLLAPSPAPSQASLGSNIIHKALGLTLDKVVIDVGKRNLAQGSHVVCSRVCHLSDLAFFHLTPD